MIKNRVFSFVIIYDFLKGKILMHSQKTDLDLFTIKQLNEVSTGEDMLLPL